MCDKMIVGKEKKNSGKRWVVSYLQEEVRRIEREKKSKNTFV